MPRKRPEEIPYTFLNGKKYYTVQDAADLYGVTRPTIYHWVRSEKLRKKYKISSMRLAGKLLVRSEYERIF